MATMRLDIKTATHVVAETYGLTPYHRLPNQKGE